MTKNKSIFKKFLGLFYKVPDKKLVFEKKPLLTTSEKQEKSEPDSDNQKNENAEEHHKSEELESYVKEKSEYPPIVTFNKVTKVFNEGTEHTFKALEDVDFQIDDIPDVGEFIALIGPSGCGKSTIFESNSGVSGSRSTYLRRNSY